MRKWYKYWLDQSCRGKLSISIDSDYEAHKKGIGGYNADEAYKDKSAFFNKYFWGYHLKRLEYYDNFLRQHAKKEKEILSIASGRCANELFLMQDGYSITCSDLEIFDAYQETKSLFPTFEFIKLNILKKPSRRKYDTVLCLSLIYLFDEKDLSTFFGNVSNSLKLGGNLILDSAGSPENLLSNFFHDILLKYETVIKGIMKSLLTHRRYGIVVKHHGYRRTDREIIESARQAGFKLVNQENYAFLTEFRRSYLLNKLIETSSIMEKTFSFLGKSIPYIRMFNFKKVI